MDANDNSIFVASQPEPCRVLGLKLLPFSLGHYFILTRHKCAFVADDVSAATRQDLIFAVLVCSMTYEQWQEFMGELPPNKLKRLWYFIRGPKAVRTIAMNGSDLQLTIMRWGAEVGIFDLPSKAKLFQDYLTQNTVSPKYFILKENKDESGGHWAHNVLVTLTGELGFTRSEALNMPLREALMHFYKHAECLGIVRLMTAEEIAIAGELEKEAV